MRRSARSSASSTSSWRSAWTSSAPHHGHAGGDRVEQLGPAVGERDHRGRLGPVAAHEPLRRGDGAQGGRRGGADERQPRRAAGPRREPVDRVLGHRAVGRELAADDGERAGLVILDDRVAAGEVGAGRLGARQQRPQAGVAADDVLRRSSRTRERGAREGEQLGLLLGRRARLVGERVDRDVGEPDRDQAVGAGEGEDPAALLGGHRDVDRRARASRAARRRRAGASPGSAAARRAVVSSPVHTPVASTTRPRADAQRAAARLVDRVGALGVDARHPHARQDAGAVRRGGARDGDHQPRVVLELAVPREQPAAQPVLGQRGGEAPRLQRADAPRGREQRAAACARRRACRRRSAARPWRSSRWRGWCRRRAGSRRAAGGRGAARRGASGWRARARTPRPGPTRRGRGSAGRRGRAWSSSGSCPGRGRRARPARPRARGSRRRARCPRR